jgi:tetratricopeptide (TPR) repeat protein
LIDIKVSGQDHPDVAKSLNNIGVVYKKKGDFENALVQHQKALEIRTHVFGSDHPDVDMSLMNVGIVLKSMGKYEEALVQHQKCIL